MFTRYHAKVAAHHLLRGGRSDAALAMSVATARVDLMPHQVDAALFALHSPLVRGAILADEVGLGKTVEASLVVAQRWAERRRRILLVVPASLRKQWCQELRQKFAIDSTILDARAHGISRKAGRRPFESLDRVVVTSYEFAASKAADLRGVRWDLVVFDEAHRLRNVFKKSGAARAKDLKEALAGRFKLLLTATPLQNSLLALYGLVSVIDDTFFGNEEAFRLLYGRKADPATLAGLRERLAPIYKRHLRSDIQAAGHVAFTDRKVLTLDFEPSEREVQLYQGISRYLQRPATIAFGEPPNPLVLTVARKVLGSSTVAIVRFLETVLERLRARQALDLAALGDVEGVDESADDREGGEIDLVPSRPRRSGGPMVSEDRTGATLTGMGSTTLSAEIGEVEGYLSLARSIGSDAKGEKLVSRLSGLLDEVKRNGGRRKVVVFTESMRTQAYLADVLSKAGHHGRIVLLNGSNSDPDSTRIHRAWARRHAGTDVVSGSKGADLKAAIVEAFRGEDADILIATESGAEGINLQFCSLLVNFDLPWNPQRVEQRIGRCHRYGQRLDVTVINFLNRRNRAEERVYELLRDKFQLFQGVFGASDGVLGVIASGVDFERAVLDIVQSCRTDEEIGQAFARLEAELDERIAADMADARRKVFDTLDQGIVRRLQARGQALGQMLDDVERRLSMVARVELPGAKFHEDAGGCRFDYLGQTWTTEWAAADERGWQFFRLGDGTLASEVVGLARHRDLPVGRVVFAPEALRTAGLPGFADVDRLRGQAGWMQVSCLVLGSHAEAERPREVFVAAAVTDDGEAIDVETVEHLFFVPGSERDMPDTDPPLQRLSSLERAHQAVRIEEARQENARWLDEENERLDAQADDLTRAADERAKALDAEVRAARKALRTDAAISLEGKVKEQRRISGLERERDTIRYETFTRQNALREQVQENLDRMAASLALTPRLEPLFTIRWEVSP